jgi:hypothetical protein
MILCLIGAVALLAVGLEVVAWRNRETRVLVEVVNDGDALLEDLVLRFGEMRFVVGDIEVGGTGRVWVDGGRKGTVALSFSQVGNPLTGFLVDDVDTAPLSDEQLKMVIHVLPNQVTKEVADGEGDPTPLSRLRRRIVEQVRAELSYPR